MANRHPAYKYLYVWLGGCIYTIQYCILPHMLRISVTSFWLDGFSQDEIVNDTQSDFLANVVYKQVNWKIATAVCNCICKTTFYESRRLGEKQGHSNYILTGQ